MIDDLLKCIIKWFSTRNFMIQFYILNLTMLLSNPNNLYTKLHISKISNVSLFGLGVAKPRTSEAIISLYFKCYLLWITYRIISLNIRRLLFVNKWSNCPASLSNLNCLWETFLCPVHLISVTSNMINRRSKFAMFHFANKFPY